MFVKWTLEVELIEIVCGAPNVQEGKKVIVALHVRELR